MPRPRRLAILATRDRWLLIPIVAAVVLVALSFAPGWLIHHRELTGEGYRTVLTEQTAWQSATLPFAGAAVALAVVAALLALARGRWTGRVPGWAPLIAAGASFGLLLAVAWPIGYARHAVRLNLEPGWALWIALAVSAVAFAAAGLAAGIRRATVAAVALAAIIAVAGVPGRALALRLDTGTGEHQSDGSYTRTATGGQATEQLVFDGGAYRIADRWSGTVIVAGPLISLVDDPACPEIRGTYHTYRSGNQDLHIVKVIDTCRDGERGDDLETGIWVRDP